MHNEDYAPMFPLLKADQIECKVKQATSRGAALLLYKTARTDYDVLDQTVGPYNWQASYQEIKGNLYCTIAIRDPESDQWISKSNCGIESRDDGEGNEKKGEASDAMKRAGVTWGIGRELYTSPFIIADVPVDPDGANRYKLKDKYERFDVAAIEYDDQRRISALTITGKFGRVVYTYPERAGNTQKTEPPTKPQEALRTAAPAGKANTPPQAQSATQEPHGSADHTENKPIALATPFQVLTIVQMIDDAENKMMIAKYGEGYARLSFEGAKKQIEEIKARKGLQSTLGTEAKNETIDARRNW